MSRIELMWVSLSLCFRPFQVSTDTRRREPCSGGYENLFPAKNHQTVLEQTTITMGRISWLCPNPAILYS